jgi:hypothetical protein
LQFSAFVDDGAVFYLNGVEIYRLRMPETHSSETLATAAPCGGNADCADEFSIPFSSLSGLVLSNNVLAVEVHNYNARSSDVTFGVALSRKDSAAPSKVAIQLSGATVRLLWSAGVLQSAAAPDGPWLDTPGNISSPATVTPSETRRFYRVRN